MTDEDKQYISAHFELLKNALKDKGMCFAIGVDKNDFNKSSLAIVDAKSIKDGKFDGMRISLEELNRGLLK